MDFGVLDFNVSTVLGIQMAIRSNLPVYERRVTISGDGITNPTNYDVRVGTRLIDLIDYCGGYKDAESDKVIVLGGPMMGQAMPSDDCICTKTVTSILIINAKKEREENCIHCGSCRLSCPVGLNPMEIVNTMKTMPVDKDKVKFLNPTICIECGLCSYSCTSKIPVEDYVRRAKMIARLK